MRKFTPGVLYISDATRTFISSNTQPSGSIPDKLPNAAEFVTPDLDTRTGEIIKHRFKRTEIILQAWEYIGTERSEPLSAD